MLLDHVFDSFISILNLLLPRLDLLRTRSLIPSNISSSTRQLLLFETLLVHLVNEHVDILTHLLELVPQLLILGLKVLLLLSVLNKL